MKFRGGVIAAVVASVFVCSMWSGPSVANADGSSKPNVVLFLLDDTNPIDGRLWSDPTLTPTLYDIFVAHGVHMPNAIDDTSLCCPARSTLLTGLHSFNHGVVHNDVRLFHPQELLAVELGNAGYQTMLIGKYLNKPEYLTGDLWTQNAAPWSVFDVFTSKYNGDVGYFYDYTMTTKDGQVLQPDEHSTQFITERTVSHIHDADPGKPIFAEVSIVDTHLPNLPMPGFEDDPRSAACDAMPPWDPPNYNEADVSLKPPFVRKLPLLPYPDGWPMATLCKEMLGVDWMVKQVTDELRADGRLDNTLLIFTADNGMAWGQHRLTLKQVPYSTFLPLYMSWPDRWGTDPREIDEYTSNIDLAPTICEIAGCTLGPYPTGQAGPDGVSLLPLLDGDVPHLGRDALIETEWDAHPWAAVRTTNLSSLGLWHYVEYQSGFRELYNVAPDQDPWELDNLAYDPDYASVIAALHDRLLELLAEGRPAQASTLTIVQDTQPNSAQDFSFSGDLGSFNLDDDKNATLPRTRTFSDLAPGTYTIEQASSTKWSLASIICPVPSVVDVQTRTATVTLLDGVSATCKFIDIRRRPDLSIAQDVIGPYKGSNRYSSVALKKQTQKRLSVAAGAEYDYFVNIQNDSKADDSFTLSADVTSAASMSATFWADGVDVTSALLDGTYTTPTLAPAQTMPIVVKVQVDPSAVVNDKQIVVVHASSVAASAAVDVVRAITIR